MPGGFARVVLVYLVRAFLILGIKDCGPHGPSRCAAGRPLVASTFKPVACHWYGVELLGFEFIMPGGFERVVLVYLVRALLLLGMKD